MDLINKTEVLRHTMDRYDHYYDSVNNKGNLFFTLDTFLFGGIITGYYSIKDEICCDVLTHVLVWSALVFCSSSILFVLRAITPYVNKPSLKFKNSILNFSCVAAVSHDDFKTAYEQLDQQNAYEDYLRQVHLLAIGLQKKFKYLKRAAICLALVFLIIIIIGIKIL